MDYLDQEQGFSPQAIGVMSKSAQKKEAGEGSKMLMKQKDKKLSKRDAALQAIMTRMKDTMKEYDSWMSNEYPDAEGDETLEDTDFTARDQAESAGFVGENMDMDADDNEVSDGDPETDVMVVGKGKDESNYSAASQTESDGQNDKKIKMNMLAATLRAKLRSKKG